MKGFTSKGKIIYLRYISPDFVVQLDKSSNNVARNKIPNQHSVALISDLIKERVEHIGDFYYDTMTFLYFTNSIGNSRE